MSVNSFLGGPVSNKLFSVTKPDFSQLSFAGRKRRESVDDNSDNESIVSQRESSRDRFQLSEDESDVSRINSEVEENKQNERYFLKNHPSLKNLKADNYDPQPAKRVFVNGEQHLGKIDEKNAVNAKIRAFGWASPMASAATAHHVHCAYGGEELSHLNPASAEHVYPDSKGGPAIDANFLPVCSKHNSDRGNYSLKSYIHNKPEIANNILKSVSELKKVDEDTSDGHFSGKNYVNYIVKFMALELNRNPKNDNVPDNPEKIKRTEAEIKDDLNIYEKQHHLALNA